MVHHPAIQPETDEPATGAMARLILCRCGHGIGVHTQAGCRAGGSVRCTCRNDARIVLESAIAQAALELRCAMPDG